jgi:hypothetical protein
VPDTVVIPGLMFGPGAGMLMYASEVAARRGATVHRHSWTEQPPRPDTPTIVDWVRAELSPVLDAAATAPLLIGKSLGSNAAALAAERGLPAVWLTPLLSQPWVAAALRAATAPFVLVGGTGDTMWNGSLAHELTPYVLEVAGADHGMYVPGPLTDSIAVLRRMVVAIEEFLDATGWPQATVSALA